MEYAGVASLAVQGIYAVYLAVNHTRCRSNCFGKQLELSIDVDKTTPPASGAHEPANLLSLVGSLKSPAVVGAPPPLRVS